MTLKEIHDWLKEIESLAGDNEEAHIEQDRMFVNFIRHVAEANEPIESLQEKAKEVLKVLDIEFTRWFA